ncbi:hypothetical protein K9U39_18485 [Rhodoblastus acidophilus]|uniref:Uncharacterized protein n=1 Tax=Candidatus Rhodoblastus alkanivorans TaxID=2954117 RepID=A0ABS9Z300_9HYPH|nr:hypothetical protein [Candidatus Rhodoblastus alkanivorans]MCI4677487.1 hypothetical protein [Candidatus Rhodoblastus alkanivorans]MCI4681846.1 hypothetical protein [Candidatus Rhodoblastus alkanivorans]MDI4642896.1 hypothetical protein [Rhodoblastus acidophilus]
MLAGHTHAMQEAERVDEDVALAARDFRARVKALLVNFAALSQRFLFASVARKVIRQAYTQKVAAFFDKNIR